MTPAILDMTCGSRMMWFNRHHPLAIYGDVRHETRTVTDRSRGNASGTRTIHINPDVRLDWAALPFPDETFRLVLFDPPHLTVAGKSSWMAAKYGILTDDWTDAIRHGFSEAWRVLAVGGILVFKWSEVQIPLSDILCLAPAVPLVGNVAGRRNGTHWLTFMKFSRITPDSAELETYP